MPACCAKEHPYQILTEYHLRQGSYKVKCNSDSSSHKPRSVLLFCGPAHTDAGQNGPGSQVGLEHVHWVRAFGLQKRRGKGKKALGNRTLNPILPITHVTMPYVDLPLRCFPGICIFLSVCMFFLVLYV